MNEQQWKIPVLIVFVAAPVLPGIWSQGSEAVVANQIKYMDIINAAHRQYMYLTQQLPSRNKKQSKVSYQDLKMNDVYYA